MYKLISGPLFSHKAEKKKVLDEYIINYQIFKSEINIHAFVFSLPTLFNLQSTKNKVMACAWSALHTFALYNHTLSLRELCSSLEKSSAFCSDF